MKKTVTFHRRSSASIPRSRWIAYATAGAASAVSCAGVADANVIYSGPIDHTFNAVRGMFSVAYFPLDQPGHSIGGVHIRSGGGHGAATFFLFHVATGSVAGFVGNGFAMFNYASKLTSGQNISACSFLVGYGRLAIPLQGESIGVNAQWQQPGTGFVGFCFNVGDGLQYGWARIHADGVRAGNSFTLIDYAFADPGERITAGQGGTASVPELGGSLGLLAIGCAGLLAWRAVRGRGAERPA